VAKQPSLWDYFSSNGCVPTLFLHGDLDEKYSGMMEALSHSASQQVKVGVPLIAFDEIHRGILCSLPSVHVIVLGSGSLLKWSCSCSLSGTS